MRFFVIKIRVVALLLLGFATLSFVFAIVLSPAIFASSPKGEFAGYVIVLDAGHGGVDGGDSGSQTGVRESEINLAITKKLEKNLTDFGFNVVLTRKNADGLYGLATSGLKMKDMRKREEIINNAEPSLVLSIHCNSYPRPSVRGAQVFFAKNSEQGGLAAQKMQSALANSIPSSHRSPLVGDYFILECSPYLSLIVECGFLSNAEDERLLSSSEHQEKVAYAMFLGALDILLC